MKETACVTVQVVSVGQIVNVSALYIMYVFQSGFNPIICIAIVTFTSVCII